MQKLAKVEANGHSSGCDVIFVTRKSKWAKPVGAEMGWRRRETEIPFRNPFFHLRRDLVELPEGKEMEFAYLERADAVVIVPVTRSGEMILVEQYRYSVDQWCLEVPAGGTHDKPDESLESVARAELHEEIGGVAESLTQVGSFFSACSLTDEKCHIFLAENVTLSAEESEPSEKIRVQLMSVASVLALVSRGEMQNAQCALAILLCEPLLRARGYLDREFILTTQAT